MGTLSDKMAADMATHSFVWCQPAIDNGQRSAQDAYNGAYRAEYFVYTLALNNRSKAEAIVRELVQRMVDATAGMDAIADDQAFLDWFEANKHNHEIGSSNVVAQMACCWLLGQNVGTDYPNACCVNRFVNAWVTTMRQLDDDPLKPEADVETELCQWLRDNVTFTEYAQGET